MLRLVTVSGPPSSGKTSVILKSINVLKAKGCKAGVVKFDCLTTSDDILYRKAEVPVVVGLSGNLCPDHFFISNLEECRQWGERLNLDLLMIESAGLCNRCSPHIQQILAVCVVDTLAGVHTPKKIGPMLRLADLVVITKGDIVSQAEREVFQFRVRQANPKASVLTLNGITGQGADELAMRLERAELVEEFGGRRLRFPMPMAMCSYCLGETKIGAEYQHGMVKKMVWPTPEKEGALHA
jgi:Ni2+-binding GTPase involved in maturation of urease and hydrogenase